MYQFDIVKSNYTENMEVLLDRKVETNKVYPVDIVCAEHGVIASSVSPNDVEDLATSHRENKKCFAHLDVNLRTDKPQISIKPY